MKGLVVAVVGCATALTACTSTVGGRAGAVVGSMTTSSAPAVRRTDLCSLLDWADLGYPGTAGAPSPTSTDSVPGVQASCEWSSQQFYAGDTPPPEPGCNTDDSGAVSGYLECMDADTRQLTQIENDSTTVAVAIAYEAGSPVPTPTSYVDTGHTVYLKQHGWSCTVATEWDHAILAITDTDDSRAFGSPCAEVRKLMVKLIQREPR